MVDCYLLLREIMFECVYNRTSECDKKLEVYAKHCGKDTHTRAQS
jgi:hypothetical protein